MSRRASFFPLLLLISFVFLLSQCGSSNSSNARLGNLPKAWAKYLAVGTITASLDIYREDGEKELSLELGIDSESGTISAPPFKLGLGSSYRFIIVFHYAVSNQESIPYAYADFTRLIDEFGEEVSFTENDIRYGVNNEDPTIATDLSRGIVPDLDLDRDGWTNWEELRDKVNPQSSSSVPIIPTVEVRGLQDGTSSTSTITIIARDNAHVEKLRLVDPICGVTVISDTQQTNVDGSVTRTMVLRLDLLSVSKSSRPLQAVADDGVTPSQDDNEVLQFSLSGSASQPYFAFTEPEEGAEIEGPTVFRGVACSRSEIDIASIKFLNSELSGVHWNGQRNDLSGDFMVESGAAETAALPDGNNLLSVEVRDSSNKVGQGGRNFIVTNDSQIKVINPVGRRWVFGNEQIAVSVRDIPDSNIVIAETAGDFNLKSSTAGGMVGVLNVSNLEEGTIVPIKFKAVRGDGSEVARTVEFTVRNKPQIEVFPKASKVFTGWSTELAVRVVNAPQNNIQVLDGLNSLNPSEMECGMDNIADRITVCTGVYPVKVPQNKSFRLTAQREPTPDEECLSCANEKLTAVATVGGLAEDLPTINVAINGDDEPTSPSRIRLQSESPAKHYRYLVKNSVTGEVVLESEIASGDTVVANGLDPRTDYREVMQFLSGPGGNVDAEMFKDVTTGDLGLVGWWRFKDDILAVDCPGENGPYTVCDYSGEGNHGDPSGGLSWIMPNSEYLDGAVRFDGQSGAIFIPHDSSLNIGVGGLTVSCLITPQHSATHLEIVSKDHPGAGPYNLGQTSADEIYFSVYSTISGTGTWKAAIGEMGTWLNSHFRATGVFEAGSIKVYFNEQLQAQTPISGSLANYSQPLKIGLSEYFNSYFNGIIDDCMIYDRPLHGNEL